MSGGKSESESGSQANFSQNVWGPSNTAYNQMVNRIGQMWPYAIGGVKGVSNQAPDVSNNMKNVFDTSMTPWQNQLAGGTPQSNALQISPDLQKSLSASLTGPSNTGKMYADIVGGQGNTYIDPMVTSMKNGVLDTLNRYGLPAAEDAAISAGQMGSSRHGISEGLLKSDAMKYMADKEAAMRGEAYDTDLNWKMDIARMADSNIGAAQDRAINMINAGNQVQQNAIKQGTDMQNLAMGRMAPYMAQAGVPWEVAGGYSNAIGRPVVLSNGTMFGNASGESKGFGV